EARALATSLFGHEQQAQRDVLLGCLLADAGDDEASLTHLERGCLLPEFPAARLLHLVCRRLACRYAAAREFARAREVALRALGRQDDSELRQLASLAESALGSTVAPDLHEQMIIQLSRLCRASSCPDHRLVRACLVAHHHLVYQ